MTFDNLYRLIIEQFTDSDEEYLSIIDQAKQIKDREQFAQQFSPYMKFQFAPHIIEVANSRQRRLLGEHEPSAYD